MTFRGNDVGNGLWHDILCRNEAILGTYVGPEMGSKAPGGDFQSNPQTNRFPFSRCRNIFFCEAATWAHFSIARDLHAVVGDRLRTTYHMPYACASHMGIHAASYGVPPNPVETDRI